MSALAMSMTIMMIAMLKENGKIIKQSEKFIVATSIKGGVSPFFVVSDFAFQHSCNVK
jgi:hypothetical protein